MRTNPLSLSDVFSPVLLLGLFAMTARPATDPDLWWHLRTGQWIVETGHVPHVDPFSFTRAGHAWVAHEWLSDLLFFEFWKHGGFTALIVFSAIVTTAGFMLLYFRCPGKRHWAAAATALGALAAAPSWGVRPQMFTFTLASLLLWLLEQGEYRPRLLLWIPPLFLLWINLHAGFALCPALLIAYGIGLTIELALGNTSRQQAYPILLRTLLLLLACLALVPINPNGAQLYRYPFDTLRSPAMRSLIGEWFSPDFHRWLYRPFLLVWLLLVAALACFRSRPKARVIVPLLLTGAAALDAVRHISIFILLATPVIVKAIPTDSAPVLGQRRPVFSRFRPLFNAAVILLMALLALVKWNSLSREQSANEAALFPRGAIQFLRTSDQPRQLFAYYDWGGYAIWNLYPQYSVFVDGRADLYGDNLVRQFETLVQLRPGWKDVLNRWKLEAVLLPPSSPLTQALLLEPSWHVAFRDSQSILFTRRYPGTESVALNRLPMAIEVKK